MSATFQWHYKVNNYFWVYRFSLIWLRSPFTQAWIIKGYGTVIPNSVGAYSRIGVGAQCHLIIEKSTNKKRRNKYELGNTRFGIPLGHLTGYRSLVGNGRQQLGFLVFIFQQGGDRCAKKRGCVKISPQHTLQARETGIGSRLSCTKVK